MNSIASKAAENFHGTTRAELVRALSERGAADLYDLSVEELHNLVCQVYRVLQPNPTKKPKTPTDWVRQAIDFKGIRPYLRYHVVLDDGWCYASDGNRLHRSGRGKVGTLPGFYDAFDNHIPFESVPFVFPTQAPVMFERFSKASGFRTDAFSYSKNLKEASNCDLLFWVHPKTERIYNAEYVNQARKFPGQDDADSVVCTWCDDDHVNLKMVGMLHVKPTLESDLNPQAVIMPMRFNLADLHDVKKGVAHE